VDQRRQESLVEGRLLVGVYLPHAEDGVHLFAPVFGTQAGTVIPAPVHKPRNDDESGIRLSAEELVEPGEIGLRFDQRPKARAGVFIERGMRVHELLEFGSRHEAAQAGEKTARIRDGPSLLQARTGESNGIRSPSDSVSLR